MISEEELQQTPAQTVDDVLRTVGGVHMILATSTATNAPSQRLSMRGLGGTRALVLLDGIPIHDPYEGTVQWQKIALDSLRQIEVVRGGSSSLFGNFALGGAINLLTRPIDSSAIRFDSSWGSHTTQRQALALDYLVSPRLGLRVSHDRFDSGGFIRVPNPGPIDIDGWNETDLTSARAEYHQDNASTSFLKASLARVDVSNGTVLSRSDRDILDLAAGTHQAVGTHGLLSATLFYEREATENRGSSVPASRDSEYLSQISDVPASALGASVEWSRQFSGSIPFVSVGLDVRQVRADEARSNFDRNGNLTETASLSGSQRFAGLFGQVSWQPTSRFELLTSARIDHFENYRGSESTSTGSSTIYPSASYTELDPRISFRYGLSPRLAFRGAAYRAFKAPTLRELYRSAPTGNSIIIGNPYLEPETLVGADLGVEWASARANLQVNLYRNEIKGLLARAQVAGQPANVFQYLNLGGSRSQGLEAMADIRLSPRWAADASYTWADSTIIEDPDPTLLGKLIPEVVPHIGTLALRYRHEAGTAIEIRGRVLSRSFGEARNVRAAPAHRVLDFSITQPVTGWLAVYGRVENALDEEYFYVLTPTALRTAQPRTITAGLRIRTPFGS